MNKRIVKIAAVLIFVTASAALLTSMKLDSDPSAASVKTSSGKVNVEDQREYAHGITFLKTGKSKGVLIWSDQYGRISINGDWTHDIYGMTVDLENPSANGRKKKLVSAPEAQEPASAAMTKNGNILVTFEDGYNNGNNELSQRYILLDKKLKVIRKYSPSRKTGRGTTVKAGGHSGHAAAVSNRFVVFWSEGWVDGGGADGLGSGKMTGLTVYSSSGKKLYSRKVAHGKDRYWWPEAVGGSRYVLLTWQKFVKNRNYAKLMYAVYDPYGNKFIKRPHAVDSSLKLRFYTYSSAYLKKSGCFLVLASDSRKNGRAYLINNKGKIISEKKGLPGVIREASPALKSGSSSYTVVYPDLNGRVTSIRVLGRKIHKSGTSKNKYSWNIRGTAGFYDNKGRACFAVLGSSKLKIVKCSSSDIK